MVSLAKESLKVPKDLCVSKVKAQVLHITLRIGLPISIK